MEKYWKIGRFSGRIRLDWGNTARADMAGLGSIGRQATSAWHFIIRRFRSRM